MKRILLILALLAGCTNTSDDFNQITSVLAPGRQVLDPRAAALAQANAPRIQVSFPQTELAGIMLLEGQRGGLDTWISADGATVQMERGMLRATRGLGEGLMASNIEQSRDLVFDGRDGLSERFHSYLTGNDETRIRTYRCQVENRGPRQITIGGLPVDTRLMAEDCRNPTQQFLNLYWVSSASNEIVQSRQWLGEFLGDFTTRIIPQ